MRRAPLSIGAVLLLPLALSGCEPDKPDQPSPAGAVIVEDPSGIVKPRQERVSVRTVKIDSAEVGMDDRRVTLRFSGGPATCWSIGQVRVEYDSRRVSIALRGGHHKLPPNERCATVLVPYSLVIALNEAVANRSVVTAG